MKTSLLLRSFLAVFLSLALVLGGMVALLYNKERQNRKATLMLKQIGRLKTQKEVISRYIQAIATDVLVMSKHHELRMMLDNNENRFRQSLAEEFLWFLRIKNIYDQIRFLDDKGMEVLRVNYNNGAPAIVPQEQLQPKGERYYFRDTIRLADKELFVSPFDLNVEHGKVEMPLKPMIRFGTPVFDSKGDKRGVVILNYLGNHLVEVLNAITNHAVAEIYLLNADGYYLHGAGPEADWGFMFESKKDRTYAKAFPRAWEKIAGAESGQFTMAEGLFTFDTIRPLTEAQVSSTGAGRPFSPSRTLVGGTDYHWKLVSHTTPGILQLENGPSAVRFLYVYIALLLLTALGSGYVVYTRAKRRQAEQEVMSHRDFLKQQVEARTAELTEVNAQLKLDIEKRKQVEAERNRLLDSMSARVKELRCTYSVTESLRQRRSLDDLFAQVVSLIPSGWRYPENARARIRYEDQVFVSEPFEPTLWFQQADIIIAGQRAGALEVFYVQQYPELDEGPFTGDERNLIDSIAGALGRAVEHRRAEEALRESEEKYRTMMEAMDDAVYICSADYRVSYMNSAMIRRVGHNAVGEKCHEVIHGREEKCPWCVHQQVMAGEHVNSEVHSPKDGKHYHVSNSPIFHTDGSVSKLTIFRDTTEIHSMEAQLQQAQKMESVGRLAGGVAHDYNNALGVIIGFTELSLDGLAPDSPLRDHLAEILKAAGNAADITRQLLAFARKQTITPRMLNLNSAIDNMLKMLRRLIGEHIELTWKPAADLWHVKIDPSQVNQILANLCVNARDAIEGVGVIYIATGNATFDEAYCADHIGFSPGQFINITVSDNGSGMEKEVLDHIFEPFFTTKGVEKGTGLGLATIYGIVRQNNGFVNVYSEPGHGTTFNIYLPRHEGDVEDIRETTVTVMPRSKGETLLLVEDDSSILKLAKRILDNLGYRTLAANSPGEALALARAHTGRIDLLVTDVIMPQMNGRDLAEQMHAHYPEIRHMFMSGYTADVVVHSGVLDEDVHFIHKPFSRMELATAVRKVLDR